MNTKTKEVAHIQPNNSVAVMSMLQSALDKGATPEVLETLVNLQERILNKEAEQAYSEAMFKCQSEMPKIIADSYNEQTKSRYAKLKAVNQVVVPAYTAHGFSLSFGSGEPLAEGWIRVTCDVRHRAGHKEQYFYDLPIDDSGLKGTKNKTLVHGSGSSASYARRYLTLMIFNIAVDDDDDGNKAGSQVITDEQFDKLNNLADEIGVDKEEFAKYCKVESLREMPMNKYNKAILALEAKRDRK